jgi:hypothetical protein
MATLPDDLWLYTFEILLEDDTSSMSLSGEKNKSGRHADILPLLLVCKTWLVRTSPQYHVYTIAVPIYKAHHYPLLCRF